MRPTSPRRLLSGKLSLTRYDYSMRKATLVAVGSGLLAASVVGLFFARGSLVSENAIQPRVNARSTAEERRAPNRPSFYKPYRIDHGGAKSLEDHGEEIKRDIRAAVLDKRQIVLVLERAGEAMDSPARFMNQYQNPAYRAAWRNALVRDDARERYVLLHDGLEPGGKMARTEAGAFNESLMSLLRWARVEGYPVEIEFEIPPIDAIPEYFLHDESWGRSLEAFLSGRPDESLRWVRESQEHDFKQIRIRDEAYHARIDALLATPGRFIFDLRGGFHDPIVTGERRSMIEAEVRRGVDGSRPILRYHLEVASGALSETDARELLKLSLLQTFLEDIFLADHRVPEARSGSVTTAMAERLRLSDEEFRLLSFSMAKVHTATAQVKPAPFENWILSHPRLGPIYRRELGANGLQ